MPVASRGDANVQTTPDNRSLEAFRGRLPRIRDATPAQAALFWESYIQTYIERDLPGISAVASTIDCQSVMRMIAITTGPLLEYSSIANNTHVSSSTVARYAETLRTAHLLDLVPPDTSGHNFTCCFPGHCSVYSWYE
jgi:uncharacterized protein